jgi:hypothetical protein
VGLGEVVDLTSIAGDGNGGGPRVARALVEGDSDKISSRITLRGGRVVRATSEANWRLNGTTYPIANKVFWAMEVDDLGTALSWAPLGPGGAEDPGFASLAGVEPDEENDDGEEIYNLRVFHTTPDGIPPGGKGDVVGVLSTDEFAHHFTMFLPLLGLEHDPALKPKVADAGVKTVQCGTGGALVQPIGG